MKKSTNKDLAEMLEAKNVNGKYDDLIRKCRDFYYHDYKSNNPTPKLALYQDLSVFPELSHLQDAVGNGEFDDAPGFDDAMSMRNDLLQNGTPENDPFFEMLGLTIEQIKKQFPEESKNL